jgi:hypothetical protein
MEGRPLSSTASLPDHVLAEVGPTRKKYASKSGRCVVCGNKKAFAKITEDKVETFRRLMPDCHLEVGQRLCRNHYKTKNTSVEQVQTNSTSGAAVSVAGALPLAPVVRDNGEAEQMSISGDSIFSQIVPASGTSMSTSGAWETSWTIGHVWQDFSCLGNPSDSVLNWLGENEPALLKVWQYLDNVNAPEDVRSAFLTGLGRFAELQLQFSSFLAPADEETKKRVDKEMSLLVTKEEELVAKSVMFVTEGVIAEFFVFAAQHAPTVLDVLERTINAKQKAKRNKSRGEDWARIWLGFVLVQLLKLRSQRANLFGFYFFGYFYLNGLPQAASSLLTPTLACDSSNFHVRAKKFIESDTFLRMQTSLLNNLTGRLNGNVVFVQDNLEKHLKSADKGKQQLKHLVTTLMCERSFRPQLAPALDLLLPIDLTWRNGPFTVDAFFLHSGESSRIVALLADVLWNSLWRSDVVPEGETKLPSRESNVAKTKSAPLVAQELNGADVSDHQRNLQFLAKVVKPQPGERIIIHGDGLFIRNVEIAKAGFSKSVNVETHFGLFHYMWNVPMQLVWMWFSRLHEVAVEIRCACFRKVTKVWTAHNDLLAAALSTYAKSAWVAWNTMSNGVAVQGEELRLRMIHFATWLYEAICVHTDMDEGHDARRFLVMLGMFWAMRRAVRKNSGDDIFLLIRWFLPFQAGLLASSMYLRLVTQWIQETLKLEPDRRDLVIFNLTANASGRPGHFIPLDMFLEHYNLSLKRLLRSRNSVVTGSHIQYLSYLIVVLCHIRDEVESYFVRPRVSQKHTVLAFRDELEQLGKRASVSSTIFLSTKVQKKGTKTKGNKDSLTESGVDHPVVFGFKQEHLGSKFRKRIRLILVGEFMDEAEELHEGEGEELTQLEQQAIENDECLD